MTQRTMYEKIWDNHVVDESDDGSAILYVDLHLVHEVTSPQAFEGLRLAKRQVRRPELTIATVDHNVPTTNPVLPIVDPMSRKQVEALQHNTKEFGVNLYDVNDKNMGIVHVIGPEQGYTRPGMTIVCGDSHTATHGAFGSFAIGIGTSQVEQVLATQCIVQSKSKTMELRVNGSLAKGVTAKDVILGIINQIGVAGGQGSVIEYSGSTIEQLSMESRMTICNMSIEAGARAGMIKPDQVTYDYMLGRPQVPTGKAFEKAVEEWSSIVSDPQARFDKVIDIDASILEPTVTWGTNPSQSAPVTGKVPNPKDQSSEIERQAQLKALDYMALEADTPIQEISIDRVFIGSCTNGRIEDLRSAAEMIAGKTIHPSVYAMVVPGSTRVKEQAEKEGLDKIFTKAGFDWRHAGCSMCLGMNPDILQPGERCASTSNRNFQGRQGPGGRTHLVSPAMAAAAAIEGHFVDIRTW